MSSREEVENSEDNFHNKIVKKILKFLRLVLGGI